MAGTPTPSQLAADAAAAKGQQFSTEEIQSPRVVALVDAKWAEDDDAAAAAERDDAADRAREALKRAAKARAEAALGDPDALNDGDPDADVASHGSGRAVRDHDLHQAMLIHEAAAVVNLHHHAAGVQNIRKPVHIILDLTTTTTSAGATSSYSSSGSTPWRTISSRTPQRRLPGLAPHGLRCQVVDLQHHLH
jgi:hypothetical protein